MKLPRRNFLHLAAAAAAVPPISRVARAQAYPSRPVRIVVGVTAGSASDIIARLMGRVGRRPRVSGDPVGPHIDESACSLKISRNLSHQKR
jgi:tripartite-type tricarboxylate transporter receptor subunit TctC